MTGSTACLVHLLVPDVRRQHLLVSTAPDSATAEPRRPMLPSLEFSTEPDVREVLDAIDVIDARADPPLRLSELGDGDDGSQQDSASTVTDPDDLPMVLLVEFDGILLEAPAGYAWSNVEDVARRVEPPSLRAAVSAWRQERDHGWSPRRPVWSRPGWYADAAEWMVEQMSLAGLPATSAPRVHHVWDLSVVLHAPSAQGGVFFKCSSDVFRHEAVVTRALAAVRPEVLPEVLAVEPDKGWMLMRDLGAAELGQQDEALWFEGLVALAGLQREWRGRAAELTSLGLPSRSLVTLAELACTWSEDDTLLARMPPELRTRWRAAAPALQEDCLRLDELGPGSSVLHGDFHPWNVTYGSGHTRIFDWTDACVSHPFIDLATYVFRTKDADVRRQLVRSYLACWQDHLPERELAEAGRLALVVGALNQVQTYRTLIPTLMSGDVLGAADVSWVERALTRRELGLDSPT